MPDVHLCGTGGRPTGDVVLRGATPCRPTSGGTPTRTAKIQPRKKREYRDAGSLSYELMVTGAGEAFGHDELALTLSIAQVRHAADIEALWLAGVIGLAEYLIRLEDLD